MHKFRRYKQYDITAIFVQVSQNAEILKINLKNRLTARKHYDIIVHDERRKSAAKFQIKNQSEKQYFNTMS